MTNLDCTRRHEGGDIGVSIIALGVYVITVINRSKAIEMLLTNILVNE